MFKLGKCILFILFKQFKNKSVKIIHCFSTYLIFSQFCIFIFPLFRTFSVGGICDRLENYLDNMTKELFLVS